MVKRFFKALLMVVFASGLTACGNNLKNMKGSAVSASSTGSSYVRSITADSSMRSVLNQRWVCSNASQTLPYDSIVLVNGPESQSLQITIHYLVDGVATTDYLVANGLDCYYSSSDSRIVKCASKADPTLKIESTVTYIRDEQVDFLGVSIEGTEKSFSVFLGGTTNRFATLADFKKTYHNPYQLKLTSTDKCGFEN